MADWTKARAIAGVERSEIVKKSKMARSGRFELPTPRFVVWCSIQLSYERFKQGFPTASRNVVEANQCQSGRGTRF